MKNSQIFCVENYVINTEGRKQRAKQMFIASPNIKMPRSKGCMYFVGGFPSEHSADNIVRINYNLTEQEIALIPASVISESMMVHTLSAGFQLLRGNDQMCFTVLKNYNRYFTFSSLSLSFSP